MRYRKEHLRELRFPLGGIGTGSVSLAGNGRLLDWEIFNRPNKGSLNGFSFFAVRAEWPDGRHVERVLQGDWTRDLSGQYSGAGSGQYYGYGFGPDTATMAGFPHFSDVVFDGRFPLAVLTFRDEGFPGTVVLEAFSPMIPLDAENSSLPAAFFTISLKQPAPGVRYTAVFSVNNPSAASVNRRLADERFTAVTLTCADRTPEEAAYFDLTAAVDDPRGFAQPYWYRGRWKDNVTTFWHELCAGRFADRVYDGPGRQDVCSVGASATAGDGRLVRFRFLLTWNAPNAYNYWQPVRDEAGRDVLWKNYYATRFADSAASCRYAWERWDDLRMRTARFADALHGATLDPAVVDAAASSLAVLKSPTVLRLADGTFYGWEGVHERGGSCEGTCTHVWSYAYALCFLFPELERSLRRTEFTYDTDGAGKMRFRTKLPLGDAQTDMAHRSTFACVDGQMATVIKTCRDWKISGDTDWLRENWDTVKRILAYAWDERNEHEWDRDRDGVLEGRQHHTLDMELFGPSAWLEGMYLAALKAGAEMADALGDAAFSAVCRDLFARGAAWTKAHLFNGEYFIQKIDLSERAPTAHFRCPEYWNEEQNELKYQIGEGCEIDQLLGQWHANLCGLGDVFDPAQRRTALRSLYRNNFHPSLREFVNTWRVYALNDEGGAVMCAYPDGARKPLIPIPYCEECMTGFEYALAGLLVSEGFIEEGLAVVRAVRNRYDGEKRNPYNEIECGSNYARAMAAFALLPIFSGFTYDLPRGEIGFSPRVGGDFRCLWSLGSGWGEFIQTEREARIVLLGGSLTICRLTLGAGGAVRAVTADGRPISFTLDGRTISMEPFTASRQIAVTFG